jgi:hypothetical protein
MKLYIWENNFGKSWFLCATNKAWDKKDKNQKAIFNNIDFIIVKFRLPRNAERQG